MFIHYEPRSAEQGLQAVELLLFASMTVNAVQQLGHIKAYGSRGIFAWRLQRHVYTPNLLKSSAASALLGSGGMTVLLLARLGIMATLAFLPGFAQGPLPILQASLLTVLFLVNGVTKFRGFLTATAAEKMASIILFCVVACAWWPDMRFHALTLYAIAAHALVCYVSNGLIKLIEPAWRSGAALQRLTQLETYSLPGVISWAAKADPRVFRWLSMGVICWETSAVLAPFLPREALYVFLAGGLVFHLVIGLVMGLNTFFWTFLSTYPAILFLNGTIDAWAIFGKV